MCFIVFMVDDVSIATCDVGPDVVSAEPDDAIEWTFSDLIE